MVADANLFQQYLKPVRTVADYANEMDQREGNQLALVAQRRQNELAGLQMEQTRAGIADAAAKRNAIQRIYDSLGPQADPLARARALQANPLTASEGIAAEKGILDNQKASAAAAKDQADAGKITADAKYKAAEHHAQGLAYVQTPADIVSYIDRGISMGIFPADQRDAALAKANSYPSVEAWKAASMQAAVPVVEHFKKAAEMERAQLSANTQIQTTKMTNDTSRANNAATNAVTMRGQNMTDSRSREATAAVMSKPFEVTGQDGLPVLVQQDKQGNIRPVQGFSPKTAAPKPMNESQAKALAFGLRMQEADKLIGELAAGGTKSPSRIKEAVEGVPLVGGALGALANAAVASPNQQSVEQAQRDFINAALRRESGANIVDNEFENARRQYFPQIGDSPQVIAQKARNRQLATRGILADVPQGNLDRFAAPGTNPPPAASGGWTVQEVK